MEKIILWCTPLVLFSLEVPAFLTQIHCFIVFTLVVYWNLLIFPGYSIPHDALGAGLVRVIHQKLILHLPHINAVLQGHGQHENGVDIDFLLLAHACLLDCSLIGLWECVILI